VELSENKMGIHLRIEALLFWSLARSAVAKTKLTFLQFHIY